MRKVGFVLWMLAVILSPAAATPDDALERASSLASAERYTEARALLDPLLERHADHPGVRLLDGILRAREGRVSEAIEIFERLRRDHPEMSEPWNNLAVLYAAEGRYDEARETLLGALERRPSVIGYGNLGDIYGKLARRPHAKARALAAQASGDVPPVAGEGAALSLPRDAPEGPVTGSPSAESDDAPPADRPGDAPSVPVACLRAGGFEDRRVLAEVEEWMESNGAEVTGLHRVRERRVGHWQAYLPPFENRGEAVARVRDIRARGVRDIAVIESGPFENGISFGTYRIAKYLHRRIAALERLGYPVRQREVRETVRIYYFDARTRGDPDFLRAAWNERFPDRSFERADCR